ncbi:MAG: ATP-binding protein, partial [bacterium]|nr:ATP-binding protein [bacterium]
IGGFANMLKNKFSQKEDAKTTHYIEIISEEAMRLENVLNRLLFYARPSTPTLVRQDFNQFVESVIAFLQKEVQSAEITVETNFDPCLISVPFDRNLMRQVLVNLIQNGIQAMEKGGILSIETRSEGGEWFVCHIRDTGVGIPEEYLSRIYEPFFSTKHAGTGLGLHVSQRIIVSHGGSIRLDSQLGQGTTVTLRLPATEVPR